MQAKERDCRIKQVLDDADRKVEMRKKRILSKQEFVKKLIIIQAEVRLEEQRKKQKHDAILKKEMIRIKEEIKEQNAAR